MSKENKFKILIVDDEKSNIDILKAALKEEYKIFAVFDGEKALQVLPKIQPDLILLDVMMPKLDGYETLAKIRANSHYKDLPVIFQTAMDEIDNKEKGFNLGAVDYITKPFELAEVKARVKTHLELKASKKEVEVLLSKTLSGSVQMMLEVLATTQPTILRLSTEAKVLVRALLKSWKLPHAWKFELAAMLSYMGCFSISDEVILKLIKGEDVDLESQKIYSTHPSLGAKLISKIPRLESVADMIANQLEPLGELDSDKEEVIGAQILVIVNHYVTGQFRKLDDADIFKELKANSNKFNQKIVSRLEKVVIEINKK